MTYVRQLDDWKVLDEITIETSSPPVLASIPGGRGVRLNPQARTPPALAVAYVEGGKEPMGITDDPSPSDSGGARALVPRPVDLS